MLAFQHFLRARHTRFSNENPELFRFDCTCPARLDQQQDDSYMECYPGAMEEAGATYDSDEDADYTKMDMVSS